VDVLEMGREPISSDIADNFFVLVKLLLSLSRMLMDSMTCVLLLEKAFFKPYTMCSIQIWMLERTYVRSTHRCSIRGVGRII